MKIRITKEIPIPVEQRPEVGAVYEAEYKMTPEPLPEMAYYVHEKGINAWVFPEECEVISNGRESDISV